MATKTFLNIVKLMQPSAPPSYDAMLDKNMAIKRRNYILLALLVSSPWLYRFVLQRYHQTKFHNERRRRLESFAEHERAANNEPLAPQTDAAVKQKKQKFDDQFYKKLWVLIKLIIPSFRSKEMGFVFMHGVFLVLRTWLSVVVARIDGRIVKHLVAGNGREFIVGLGYWFGISIPATYTNSMIKYLQSKLAIAFRTRLTRHLTDCYMQDLVYYKMLNLDSRIQGPDQLICNDVARFCDSLASLYSNMAKPILDILIFTFQLTNSIGVTGMGFIYLNYFFTATLLRKVTPGFGRLAAVEAKLEGDFRGAHTRLITNAEEIAFYDGGERELGILDRSYHTLIRHVNRIFRLRIFYNMFEDFIIKYAWSAVGLLICSVPVFFPSIAGSRAQRTDAASHGSRTQGFITNKRLMISLADAGGRIMYAQKEMAELAGYTTRVHELLIVLQDMKMARYERTMVTAQEMAGTIQYSEKQHQYSLKSIGGNIQYSDKEIQLVNVPIVTPSGDRLIRDLTVDIKPGMHLLISGGNGVGKSAIMRVISGLWPVFQGTMYRPFDTSIIFISQRPYLSIGTLRDQVIYPLSHAEMIASGRTDSDLINILKIVHLDYIPEREGGFDSVREWKDTLSGGEKQRMNLARVFYHQPAFAVLDESTSAVSADVEGLMYQRAQDFGITLITISHKPSLFKYHKYLLRLGGEDQNWEWSELVGAQLKQTVASEILDLQRKIGEEGRMQMRLNEINRLLGVQIQAIKK